MFSLYGLSGQHFRGTLEQLAELPGVTGARRGRAIARDGEEPLPTFVARAGEHLDRCEVGSRYRAGVSPADSGVASSGGAASCSGVETSVASTAAAGSCASAVTIADAPSSRMSPSPSAISCPETQLGQKLTAAGTQTLVDSRQQPGSHLRRAQRVCGQRRPGLWFDRFA